MDFNLLLQKKRRQVGLSIENLSKKSGISVTTLIKFENGSAIPTLESFVKLCDSLETSPNEMLNGVSFSHHTKKCNDQKQGSADLSTYSLGKDEKIQYVKSLKARGGRLYSAYLQRKLGVKYDEAQELLRIVNSSK